MLRDRLNVSDLSTAASREQVNRFQLSIPLDTLTHVKRVYSLSFSNLTASCGAVPNDRDDESPPSRAESSGADRWLASDNFKKTLPTADVLWRIRQERIATHHVREGTLPDTDAFQVAAGAPDQLL